MSKIQYINAGIYLLGVILATVSQLLLKRAAMTEHASFFKEYLNIPVVSAYCLLLASTMLTVIALRELPVSLAAVLGALEYVFVSVIGRVCFHERLSWGKILGIACILIGVILFAL